MTLSILLTIHSWVRWLALLAAIIALVKHLIGWLGGGRYDGMARGSLAAFSGLLDLNVVIGLIQLVVNWGAYSAVGFPRTQVEHAFALLLAVIAAHLPARLWRDKADTIRYRNTFFAIAASVLLVVAGVMALQGERWVFRGL